MTKKQFNHTLALLSTVSLVAGSQAVYAENNDDAITEVVVSGFRQAVLNSVEAKRQSDVVSDVVDASALGSLPAVSIADALGRIPGVTTVRSSGHTSELNIRGMNGDFIETTLNGNEQASTSSYTASSRWMAFDQYPSELITQAAVFKSPKASLIEGGVAGTVEMKTVDPLTAKKDQNFTVGIKATTNDAAKNVGADANGNRASFSYQGKFLDETVGIAVGAAHLKQPNNFSGARAGADGKIGYSMYDVDGDGTKEALPQSLQYQAGYGEDTRNGYLATAVFKPSDSFKAQVDYFKSTYDSSDLRHGVTVSGLDNGLSQFALVNPTINNGVVTSGTINLTKPNTSFQGAPWIEARTEDQSTKADSEAYGLNVDWSPTDKATLKFNLSHSSGTKTRKDRLTSMAPYEFGTVTNANGSVSDTWKEPAGESFTFKLNGDEIPTLSFSDPNLLTGSNVHLSRYEEYPHLYTDKIDSVKVDFKYELDLGFVSAIEAGVRISDRTFDSHRGAFLYGSRDGQFNYVDGSGNWNSYCADNLSSIACKPQPLGNFVSVGHAQGAPDHDVVNMGALADSIFGKGNYYGKQVFSQDWTYVESGKLEEKVQAFYLMANIASKIGNVPVTGNVGVRVVKTDEKASGLQNVGDDKGIPITDDVGVTRTNYAPVTYGPEYTDVLPSLNLNFAVTDEDNVRLAVAKVMGRPPAGQLKGGAGSWNDTQNNPDGSSQLRYNVWTKGSPYLDPFRANQIDLSYEHYFADGGSATIAGFWKDIKSLTENVSYSPEQTQSQGIFDKLGLKIPEGQIAGVYQTVGNTKKGGYIRGIELATTQTFNKLPGIFSGLGVTASYSYTESETEVSGGNLFAKKLPLYGLSRNVWSATGFWDIGHFSTHVNVHYRDNYVQNLPIPGSSTPAWAKKYTTVDYQASYSFENGIEVVFEADNLTNAANVVSYGQDNALGEYKIYGRNYALGVNYKF